MEIIEIHPVSALGAVKIVLDIIHPLIAVLCLFDAEVGNGTPVAQTELAKDRVIAVYDEMGVRCDPLHDLSVDYVVIPLSGRLITGYIVYHKILRPQESYDQFEISLVHLQHQGIGLYRVTLGLIHDGGGHSLPLVGSVPVAADLHACSFQDLRDQFGG